MSSLDEPSTRNQALVAALQWGVALAFLLDTLGRLLQNYHQATASSAVPPLWITSIQFAVPFAILVGGYGGYRWVRSGRATMTVPVHRTRVKFVGALLVGWALAIVPTLVFQEILDGHLFTVPYFILPTLTALVVFLGAYLFAYRADTSWYRVHRAEVLGAVQGAFVGGIIGVVSFVMYVRYFLPVGADFSLNGGLGTVTAICLGALVGYLLADTEASGDRSLEFLTLLVSMEFGVALLSAIGTYAFAITGITIGEIGSTLLFVGPVVLVVAVAGYLTYITRTTFYQRLTGVTGQ